MSSAQFTQNKTIVQRMYDEIFNANNADSIAELIAPDIVLHDPVMGELHGIEAFRQFVAVFQLAFPQQHTSVESSIAEDDLVATLHTHEGIHTGSFMGLPPTGKAIKVRGIELFRLRDGKIVDLWRHDDDAGLMQQLGMLPAPTGEVAKG